MSTFAYLLLFALLGFGRAQEAWEDILRKDTFIYKTGPVPTRTSNVSCLLPPHPANGVRSQRYCVAYNGVCDFPTTNDLTPGTVLIYSCDTGYKVSGNPLVLCNVEGNWSTIPDCIAVTCDPLGTASTTAKCLRLGRWVDCDSSFLEGSRARVSCRPGFSRVKSPTKIQSETVECNKEGKWEPDPIECVPDCGVAAPGGTTTGFPWHASVYSGYALSDSKMRYDCEGTVVRDNLVLTAASCVWDTWVYNPATVFVMTGHNFEMWGHPLNDPKMARKSGVRNIHMHCDHRREAGVADLALLELIEPLEFSSTLVPACLEDYSREDVVDLEPDVYGSIAEFGKGYSGSSRVDNNIVSINTIPYIPYSQCKALDNRTDRFQFLTSDKFCAGYLNGSTSCVYHRGSGLLFKKNDLWYVMGVMCDLEPGCNNYTLFTNLSRYTEWIQRVIFNLDHYKTHPICEGERSWAPVTTATDTTAINQTLPTYDGPVCLTPPQPANGAWKPHQSLCPDEAECIILRGASVRPGALLTYSCTPGYEAIGSTEVYCGSSGNWSAIPLCTEIKCDSLNSVSRTTSCHGRWGEWVSCDSPVPPGTRAVISCRLGYKRDTAFSTFRRKTVICGGNGEWTPDPIKCLPDCGVAITDQKPFIINGTSAKISEFPWHATLYIQERSRNGIQKKFICGATIIQTNFLLTAAHCIYDETTKTTADPEKLFVITGNIFRDYDSPFHNPVSVRKTAVLNVHRPCEYYGLRGNYASDIALLELETPFDFSSILLPACLDVQGYSDQILEPGAYGKVAGFGRTETGESSGVLQTLTLPYIAYNKCKSSKRDDKNNVFISKDKFCAGYMDGSAVCEGDSGGGLVFQKRGLWYVMGVVSVGLGVDIDNGEKTCDRYSYSLYTRVSEYMTWIRDVTFQRAQRNPYPPCDARV